MGNSFGTFSDEADNTGLLKEVARVLKAGGGGIFGRPRKCEIYKIQFLSRRVGVDQQWTYWYAKEHSNWNQIRKQKPHCLS